MLVKRIQPHQTCQGNIRVMLGDFIVYELVFSTLSPTNLWRIFQIFKFVPQNKQIQNLLCVLNSAPTPPPLKLNFTKFTAQFLPLVICSQYHEDVWEVEVWLHILNLCSRWSCVFSFTLGRHYVPQCLQDTMLAGSANERDRGRDICFGHHQAPLVKPVAQSL